jgi:uncharacterized membrane protein
MALMGFLIAAELVVVVILLANFKNSLQEDMTTLVSGWNRMESLLEKILKQGELRGVASPPLEGSSAEAAVAYAEASAPEANPLQEEFALPPNADFGPVLAVLNASEVPGCLLAETEAEAEGEMQPPSEYLPMEAVCMTALPEELDEAAELPPAIPVIPVAAEKAPPRPVPPSETFYRQPYESKASGKPAEKGFFERFEVEIQWEKLLGFHAITWIGIAMMLVCGGFLLKLGIDKGVLTPPRRVALWTGVSVVGLILGELAFRANYKVLFKALTGGSVAGLYTCIFFAMDRWQLCSPNTAIILASGVTLFAIFIAVMRESQSLALLALLGGYMSPFLFSTGDNRPYALFNYLLVLDCIAFGAAFFRRWRHLNTAAFTGTILLYQAWMWSVRHGMPGVEFSTQIMPGMIYATVFYLFFLAVSAAYSLTRREHGVTMESRMIIVNSVLTALSCWVWLKDGHQMALGFFVLGMAAVTMGLFWGWMRRIGRADPTTRVLLVQALVLVTLAVPIQFKGHATMLVWAAQGVALVYAGGLFKDVLVRLGGHAALLLGTVKMLANLPLHTAEFTPVFNPDFMTWAFVTGAWAASAWVVFRHRVFEDEQERLLAIVHGLGAFVLGTAAASMEVAYWWQIDMRENPLWHSYQGQSLLVLWSAVTACTAVLTLRRHPDWRPITWISTGIAAIILLIYLAEYRSGIAALALNPAFLSHLFYILVLWGMAWGYWRARETMLARGHELAGHGLFLFMVVMELVRWDRGSGVADQRIAMSLISAAWAAQALVLVWHGLVSRELFRRAVGMGLFGVTIAKVILIDTAQLEVGYRVISWGACGALLLITAYFYQRFSAALSVTEETAPAAEQSVTTVEESVTTVEESAGNGGEEQ